MEDRNELNKLALEFQQSQKVLTALGDQMRQHIILILMEQGDCNGMRVNDIAAKTSLSRPAVSHHLQIMKDAGILKVRKEGTKNFYYFDVDEEIFDQLENLLHHTKSFMCTLPDRSGEE